MMVIDWGAVLLGFSVGVPVSLLFFAGLAWGMRRALRSTRPELVLLLSSGSRIAMLLAVGLRVAASGRWPLAGYVLAFFLVRLAAVRWAKASRAPGLTEPEGG